MSKLVRRADNKGIERVLSIQSIVDRVKIETSLRRFFRLCGRLFDHIYDIDFTKTCRSGRIKNNVDVFIEPVPEEGVGNSNVKGRSFVPDELRGLEPGAVALRTYFFLDLI